MKQNHLFFRLALLVCVVQLVSCSKSVDTSGDPSSLSAATSQDATAALTCRIKSMVQDYGGEMSTAVFAYNAAGNPSSIKYTPNGTGNPNHYFYYDAQNRLIDWRKTYNNGNVVAERHKYVYSGNLCVRDTMIVREGTVYVFVSYLEYDSQGRIIKETIKNILAPNGQLQKTRIKTYTYDIRGNIGVLNWPASKYDYKVSPLRLSPVFNLVLRNYSQNNPAAQAKYNSQGLPLSLNPTNYNFFNSGLTYSIVYDCP